MASLVNSTDPDRCPHCGAQSSLREVLVVKSVLYAFFTCKGVSRHKWGRQAKAQWKR